MDETSESRRQFLKASGGAFGAAWLATQWPQVCAAAEHAHAMAEATDVPAAGKLLWLTADQARDVEAIAAQIVPSGATPGAREAGVVYFIDHVHAGPWRRYADDFLAGLAEFRRQFARHHPEVERFADLQSSDQVAYLRHMQHTPMFARMRFLTVLGLLSSPVYGGNRGKAGWTLVGFVDQHVWQPPFGHYDAGYPGFVPYPSEAKA